MSDAPTLMAREAAEAPALAAALRALNRDAADALAARLRALDPPLALTIARGSSGHAAAFAGHLIATRLRLPVASLPPSVATLYRATSPRLRGALVLAISQSGRSPDLVEAARAARAAGALVLAVVNDPASPLAEQAEFVLPLHAGAERSVAATKSFIASLVAVADLVARWRGDAGLADALGRIEPSLALAWQQDWGAALAPLERAGRLLVLGRGPTLPIAAEAALKLKETAQIHAEAFSSAEVAHGPMALIGAGDPLLAFAPADVAGQGFGERLAAFAGRGATVIAAGPAAAIAPATIRLPSVATGDAAADAIALALSFYRMAEALARRRGRDPDRPPFLSKVTSTL